MRRRLSLLLLAGLLAPAISLAAVPLAVVSMEPYFRQLRTVPVRIGESELPFIIDTAGGITCIGPELAAEVGCVPFGGGSGFRLSGERLDLEECGEMTLHVGEIPLTVEVTLLDMNALLEGLPPVGGLISVHTFAGQPFSFDLEGGTLTLESPGSLAERTASMAELNARFAHQAGGATLDPFVEVRSSKGRVWMELDCGNIGRTLLAPHVIDQLDLPSTEDQTATLDLLGLGPVTLEVGFVDGSIYDGVLGVELFESRVVTFDPPGERIWVSR